MDNHDLDVPNVVPTTGTSDNVVPAYTNHTNAVPDGVSNGVNAANGEQRCPHCRAPIAVIAILVPPTAAHVRTPEVTTPPA